MKYLLIICGLLLSTNTYAGSVVSDVNAITPPSSVSLESLDNFEAKDETSYKGRNENRAVTKELQKTSAGSSLSRSVIMTKSNKDSQLENLESTVGELVQKVEDDRLRKSATHESLFKSSKSTLQSAYDTTKQIDEGRLGNEQDPNVQGPFKCSNLRNCDTSENDSHAIPACGASQRLTWSGQKWQCIGVFEDPGKPNCDSTQWSKDVNGGKACIDYIYVWEKTGVAGCQPDDKADHIYQCMKKKYTKDTGTAVSDVNCFGDKPEGKDSCTYEGVWVTRNWGGCSKSCGGGVKTRKVTCSQTYCKPNTKPAVSTSCNTQRCPIPVYYCPSVYGAGWSPSGAHCVKSSYACTYSSSSRCTKYWSNGCKGNVGSQGVYASFNGTRVYSGGGRNSNVHTFPGTFAYGGVTYRCGSHRNTEESSRNCGSRHGSARSESSYYEICRNNVQYRSICPAGWYYSGGVCR